MASVGIVTALDFERRALGGAGFAVRGCGIGGVGSAAAVRALGAAGSRLIVSWGTAAALSSRLRAGDLCVPRQVLAGDGAGLASDERWRAAFTAAAGSARPVHPGLLVHSPRIVTEPRDKHRLGASSGADAVDMESAPIGATCAQLGLAFLAVRVVLDEVEDRLPERLTAAIDADGVLHTGRLLAAVGGHPGDWSALVRLGRRYRRARAALGAAARALARCAEAET